MKLYKVRIRLNGSVLNEVWKTHVTAAELQVLERIHNGGNNYPFAEVSEMGSVHRSDEKERSRLRSVYHEWGLGEGDKLIREVLGAPGTPLPQVWVVPVFDPDEEWDDDQPENIEDAAPAEHIVELAKPVQIMKDRPERTRVGRPPKNPDSAIAA